MWTFLNELINLYNRDVQQKDRNHNNGQAEERKERKEKKDRVCHNTIAVYHTALQRITGEERGEKR